MQSSTLLSLLIAGASCSGAVFYGMHHGNVSGQDQGVAQVEALNRITQLEEELAQLQSENLALKELAQANGDVVVPNELIEFIEKDNNLNFKKPTTVIRSNYDEIQKAAEEKWTKYFGWEGMQWRAVVFEKIGLIPPQSSFVDQLAIAVTGPESTRALFDHGKDREPVIMVPMDFDMNSQTDSAALVQMLTIALVEQHYPIDPTTKLTDDTWNCRQAIIHANSLMTRSYFMNKTARRFEVLGSPIEPSQASLNAAETFRQLPKYVQELAGSFGALKGRDFIDKKQSEDRKTTLETCLKQATSSNVVLNGKENMPIPLSDREQNSSTDTLLLETQLGALAVLTHARRGSTISKPLEFIKAFANDQLTIKRTAKKVQIYRWVTYFNDEKSAEQFALHLKDIRPEATTSLKGVSVSIEVRKNPSQKHKSHLNTVPKQ